jgi:ATP-dependent helicase/DNAse subunit B
LIYEEELKIKIDNKEDIFSYSKLNTFLQCPYRYKKKYIEHIKSDKKSVESFMGSIVHVCLEKLYNERLNLTSLKQLYDEKFPNKLPENIFVVRRKGEYRENGGRLLSDYYREFYETDDSLTLDTEHKVKGEIAGKEFIGYIDRLSISEYL